MIIFDSNSLADLEKYLLKNQSYFILINKYKDKKEIFLSLEIIICFILNTKFLFKKDVFIQDIYFLSIIQILRPKLVFTFIDNSPQFFKLCRMNTNKNIKFLAF